MDKDLEQLRTRLAQYDLVNECEPELKAIEKSLKDYEKEIEKGKKFIKIIREAYANGGGEFINDKGEKKQTMFACPSVLRYQFTPENKIKISDKCCFKLKKEPAHKWQVANNKTIVLTGMRSEEGGARARLNCVVTNKEGKIVKFHPLVKVDEEWENEFISKNHIYICKIYQEPYNFKRTGCKGCPYALNLQHDLEVMEKYMPNERKQCEVIWKPIYEEYRRLGYRLKKVEEIKLF